MEEIKEAYCSYEVSKLLKEKGFDEPCECFYDSENNDVFIVNGWMNISNSELEEREFLCYSAPTHQMACAWIRKKGYSVEVHVTPVGWHWEVCTVGGTLIASSGACDNYDKCMENALMYTLTNII